MILFIDCYDSFSYNLTHLIESACGSGVSVVHNDKISVEQIKDLLPQLDAIVIGPGPGDPHKPEDRGVIDGLWELVKSNPLPVFGVCFGYQSLVLSYGGVVQRMQPPRHGRVSKIAFTVNSRLFRGIDQGFEVVRYHSLCCEVNSALICSATAENDGIEMAAEHEKLPFFGVQFHPESVKSTFGKQLFVNFWKIASEFNSSNRSLVKKQIPKSLTVNYEPLCSAAAMYSLTGETVPDIHITSWAAQTNWLALAKTLAPNFVLLKSAATPGKFSIFGILEPGETIHIRAKGRAVFEGRLKQEDTYVRQQTTNIWQHAANFMAARKITGQQSHEINSVHKLPFLGGLMGYVSYEGACLHTVDDEEKDETEEGSDGVMNSDVSFVYVTKSLILDEASGVIYAVGPRSWSVSAQKEMEARIDVSSSASSSSSNRHLPLKHKVESIDFDEYKHKFDACIEKLASGDSYELCLTTQAKIDFEREVTPLEVFEKLVTNNPAPYSSFMDFDDCLIATSPERFMAWDHDMCEFRPIKGTVKKAPHLGLAEATKILKTDKEQAENLMIVDLIRHDIGHLLTNVTTPQLMVVEEYHSVYQLVTSVQGQFSASSRVRGIDVLSQSLPPGSMTGAPKQRSCHILKQVEGSPRGLYSGVQGYWSIDDRGDWSVIIRSLFKSAKEGVWRLGAGGGVTILSTAEGEFEEMQTKMSAVLAALNK